MRQAITTEPTQFMLEEATLKTANHLELLNRFNRVRSRTEALCAPLTIEDHIPQVVFYASPPKWHLAHSTWFFEEMILKKNAHDYREFHRDFNYYFNSYYNSIVERSGRNERGTVTRPGVEEVYDYRAYVNEAMEKLLSQSQSEEVEELVRLGLRHEEQHQELLITDLKVAFAHHPFNPVYDAQMDLAGGKDLADDGWVKIDEGLYQVGAAELVTEAFDNEKPAHRVYLYPSQLRKSLVRNEEFIAFIEDGGYQRPELWLDDGWSWIKDNYVKNPMYWKRQEGKWFRYSLAGLKQLDSKELLCHTSYYEADAFATWAGCRLPLETEWEVLAGKLEWGKRWEWSGSAYRPYPGFKLPEGPVREYNGKFMVNQMVLKGASTATAPGHSRLTYRNFFHPEMRWQYNGIRLAKDQ